ncbi:hypothetical protein E2C01_049625 [Portunus trituberculatus]|uniref:Uncharacterized protein n=1 Tax=Portunus trituberculatus TaxID=210409 RepID=A0A5B7G6W9_PORTR|nr:hypothetical protein [Portunus trituberculatus]
MRSSGGGVEVRERRGKQGEVMEMMEGPGGAQEPGSFSGLRPYQPARAAPLNAPAPLPPLLHQPLAARTQNTMEKKGLMDVKRHFIYPKLTRGREITLRHATVKETSSRAICQ